MKEKKSLTKAETQLMNILWNLPEQKGSSAEIMAQYPEPKPALTTLLTFLKMLQEKGFVAAEKIGRGSIFSALISKSDYTSYYMREVKNTFFGGSLTSLVSFFAKEEHLSEKEIDEIMNIFEKMKK